MERINDGVYVQHFKREYKNIGTNYCYKVLNTNVLNTETKERMVVYQALYDDFSYFCRPYDMFISEVDKIKYPDIHQHYRFETVADSELLERCKVVCERLKIQFS